MKSASSMRVTSPDALSGSFYATTPDRSINKKSIFAEKRAAFLTALAKEAEDRWAHGGYSDRTLGAMASDSYSVIKAAEQDVRSAIGTIDDYLMTATMKIANDLSKGPYDTPVDRANLFKVACPHPMVLREVSKFSPLLKKASGGRYATMQVVDTSSVDELLKEADSIMEAVKARAEYRKKQAEFHDKAERLRSAVLSDPSMPSAVTKKAGFSDLIHAPKTVKKAGVDASLIMDALGNIESRKKVNERLRDDTRGAILADLLSADPILQDADPRQVSSIYKSLIATSPRVSLNKEVVRSVLRGAVNSIAMSPADSKILTDVDKGVQTAFGGITRE